MSLPDAIQSDPRYKDKVVPIIDTSDIPKEWRHSPIEKLICAENFGHHVESGSQPQLLIATCIEFRYALPIPRMYAYVIRRASGRLVGSEFSLAYIFSRGVRHLALIGHNDCGMTKVAENMKPMTQALIDQGWNPERAEEFINYQAARHAIPDELSALEREYHRLRRLFRNLTIAPLFVCLSDTKLYIPKWYLDTPKDQGGKEVLDEDLLTLAPG